MVQETFDAKPWAVIVDASTCKNSEYNLVHEQEIETRSNKRKATEDMWF